MISALRRLYLRAGIVLLKARVEHLERKIARRM